MTLVIMAFATPLPKIFDTAYRLSAFNTISFLFGKTIEPPADAQGAKTASVFAFGYARTRRKSIFRSRGRRAQS
jgi:hypothetical protein